MRTHLGHCEAILARIRHCSSLGAAMAGGGGGVWEPWFSLDWHPQIGMSQVLGRISLAGPMSQRWLAGAGGGGVDGQWEGQPNNTKHMSHTRRDEGEDSRQGGRWRQDIKDSESREPQSRGWESMCMGGSNNKGDGLVSQSRRDRVPTPAQPASAEGCLPQPRRAVCAKGAGAHQGQTYGEGKRDIWRTVGTTRGGAGHLAVLDVAWRAVCASVVPSSWRIEAVLVIAGVV